MLRLGELAYWINERERVRQRKESGAPPPWTNNTIIANTRFCNVRREDDKVTRWIRQNWGGYVHHKNYTLAMALARFINWIPTLEVIAFPEHWTPKALKDLLYLRAKNEQVFGGAYIISTNGRKMSKIDYVVDVVLDPLHNSLHAPFVQRMFDRPCTLLEAHHWFIQQQGIGSFMSGQLIADLKNTAGHPLSYALDWERFCCAGPGSKRGLNRLYGRDVNAAMTEEVFQELIQPLHDLLPPLLDRAVFTHPVLHMQDIQNCMCEFDKFIRVKEGGRAKSNYRAR